MTFSHMLPGSRDPSSLLADTMKAWGGHGDIWVFGYASLIWRPEFDAAEQRPATVYGWHRALQMRSRVNRGTPERPGLVFALVHGGCCRGMVYRIEEKDVPAQLERLWAREMPTGIYDPKWLSCRTAEAASRRSPSRCIARARATPVRFPMRRWSTSFAARSVATAVPCTT